MTKNEFKTFEDYMLSCMGDSAHDKEHVYRVLYTAMDIAEGEAGVNYDVLITACLLHDIARAQQLQTPRLCHATVGAEQAYAFLVKSGYALDFAEGVAHCIRTHRFRSDNPPQSTEAKILFDADKLDAAGAIGIARTLLYKGALGEPLYTLNDDGFISDGTGDTQASFFQEYKFKLERLYSVFYTRRGAEIALQRQQSAVQTYRLLLSEAQASYRAKSKLLGGFLK